LSGKQDDLVFGYNPFLRPLIVLGLGTFGYYALMGDYDEKLTIKPFFLICSLYIYMWRLLISTLTKTFKSTDQKVYQNKISL
jgi:hypothetical protein